MEFKNKKQLKNFLNDIAGNKEQVFYTEHKDKETRMKDLDNLKHDFQLLIESL